MSAEVGRVQKATVLAGTRIETACGAAIRSANPMRMRASENTVMLIILVRTTLLLALSEDKNQTGFGGEADIRRERHCDR